MRAGVSGPLAGGRDDWSVAFAPRFRCLPARSGPADGCRGRGCRCRSRFQRFDYGKRRREKPEEEPGGTKKQPPTGATSPKKDPGGTKKQPPTGATSPKKEPGGTEDETNDSGLVAAVTNPVAAVSNVVAPVLMW